MIPWHRLFGIALTDLLAGTAWEVVLELDLSVKQQLLDIVVVRRGKGPQPRELPDGLGPLADHNLVTYKSLREPLDGWALKELAAHSVNYRKQVSPSLDRLLPEASFRLFAVCTRYPQKLATQVVWQTIGPGVYDVPWGTDTIRLLVLNEMPTDDRNAVWNLFSADRERVDYAAGRFRRQQHSEASSLLKLLYENYKEEGVAMPYTKQDFWRDVTKAHLDSLSPKERLAGISPDELLAAISPDEFLAAMPTEQLRTIVRKAEQRLARSPAKKASQAKPRTKSSRVTKTR